MNVGVVSYPRTQLQVNRCKRIIAQHHLLKYSWLQPESWTQIQWRTAIWLCVVMKCRLPQTSELRAKKYNKEIRYRVFNPYYRYSNYQSFQKYKSIREIKENKYDPSMQASGIISLVSFFAFVFLIMNATQHVWTWNGSEWRKVNDT